MLKGRQPWLADARQETLLILAPSIIPVVIVFVFQDYFLSAGLSTAWWVLLVLCIDVGHVYSTLFRFYWDRNTYLTHRNLLWMIPLIAFVTGFALHYYDAMLFWRLMAYVAVFHFIRQQYGFMRLYSRHEPYNKVTRGIDALCIYAATIYPVLYWHVHATEELTWFVKGDFLKLNLQNVFPVFTILYVAILAGYVTKEALQWRAGFNLPKNLIVLGTILSWYVGIVLFQADLIFTLLNVVAHGIPYVGLVWIHGKKRNGGKISFGYQRIAVFIAMLLVLAYLEEYFWDGLVWHDHPEIFPTLADWSVENPVLVSITVAILVLPQVTHYVLDGFIWRISKGSVSYGETKKAEHHSVNS